MTAIRVFIFILHSSCRVRVPCQVSFGPDDVRSTDATEMGRSPNFACAALPRISVSLRQSAGGRCATGAAKRTAGRACKSKIEHEKVEARRKPQFGSGPYQFDREPIRGVAFLRWIRRLRLRAEQLLLSRREPSRENPSAGPADGAERRILILRDGKICAPS